jgi:hypothetical protein
MGTVESCKYWGSGVFTAIVKFDGFSNGVLAKEGQVEPCPYSKEEIRTFAANRRVKKLVADDKAALMAQLGW